MTHSDIAKMIHVVLSSTSVQFDFAQNAVDMKEWLDAIIRGELVVTIDETYVPPRPNEGGVDSPGGDVPDTGAPVDLVTQPTDRQPPRRTEL